MAFFDHIIHRMQVRIRWARIIVGRIIRFITHDIWFLNMKDLSRWNARMVQDAKVVLLMLRTFSDQKIGYQVTALAYRSVMSVIPFLAIAFYLTGGLGISDILVDFLQENIEDESLLSGILDAATNILTTAESGLFGLISMLSFFWIVISLMLTVRQVFNNVWRAKETTNVFKLAGILLVILILSPLVIILFFSGSVVY